MPLTRGRPIRLATRDDKIKDPTILQQFVGLVTESAYG